MGFGGWGRRLVARESGERRVAAGGRAVHGAVEGSSAMVSSVPRGSWQVRWAPGLRLVRGQRRRDAGAEFGPQQRPVEEMLRLAAEVESVAVGRRWLRDVLEREFGQGHPKVDDALQALSEVLTNAVLYGAGPHVRLTCTVDGDGAEVAVDNDGRAGGVRPQRQNAAPDAEGGRGLDLVAAFSDQWGIKLMPQDEVKVWFRVRFA